MAATERFETQRGPTSGRPRPGDGRLLAAGVVVALLLATPAWVASGAGRSTGWGGEPGLEAEPGRNDVRVTSAPYPLTLGMTIEAMELPRRLERLGYQRVHRRPERPGEFFWGHDVFWVFRRAHGRAGLEVPARLVGLALDRDSGRAVGYLGPDGEPVGTGLFAWLEPELLAESLGLDEGRRVPVRLAVLPEHVWRAVLAAEDHRFFDHSGLDARGIARALLENLRSGEVAQGGSTITQQLVKVRDLSPRRTLGRKLSEAGRALALEAEYDKEEILQSYLGHVYLGHVGGRAVRGVGTAARSYFGKPVAELDLGEAALLAGMIQAPNRLDPVAHPEAALARQRRVLERMEELGWAPPEEVERERRRGLPRLAVQAPAPPAVPRLLSWLEAVVAGETDRLDEGRGVLVETAIDPILQEWAEEAVAAGLASLRRAHPRLRSRPLSAALVALDGTTGGVLAHVGGDPRAVERGGDAFDRVHRARRQPGSTVKPLVLLEAFDDCGRREPVYPARRISDAPLTLELPSGPWTPRNPDDRSHGTVDAREALASSLNVPFVRLARWCGFDETAETLERAGLSLPAELPPAFVLGAVEVTPAELAGAYTAFTTLGRAMEPRPASWIARPGGGRIARFEPESTRVADPPATYLVRDLLRDAVLTGTARAAGAPGLDAFAKTGTSSASRDAWLAGGAGSVVAVVWVGLDDGSSLGLSGGAAAAPIWKAFMEQAVRARPPHELPVPEEIVTRRVQDRTGLLVDRPRRDSHVELFDRRYLPPSRRLLLPDEPLDVIE